jgi:stearoyl-CoA desaturase (delta-9 desaturase)
MSYDVVDAGSKAGMSMSTGRAKLKTDTLIGFVLCHCLAALALFPWFFSWTGITVAAAGIFVFGVLGLNVGFHRLLTHRSFVCPLWLEHTLAILGTCSLQFSPAFWVAVHRRHHHHSDDELDPHSPSQSFFWSHFGWLLVRPDDMRPRVMIDRYARDLTRDPLYVFLERRKNWMKFPVASWLVFFIAGFAGAIAAGEGQPAALQFGASLFVWGGPLRTVLVWHSTWSVNSVTHLWGYRNYATNDDSRNNAIVGLLAAGEGWHNNHHADPASARHGHKWWEFDLTWQVIRLLMFLGLATQVTLPSPRLSAIAGRRQPSLPAE